MTIDTLSERAREAVSALVDELAMGNYRALGEDGRAGRCTPEELETAVNEYGRTLMPLPPEAWSCVHLYPVRSGETVVDIDLWTVEEGRSDLTLSLRVFETGAAARVQIEDLHVL